MVDTTGGAGDAALAPAKALQPVRVRVDSVRRRLAGQRGFDVRRDGGIKVVASFLRVPGRMRRDDTVVKADQRVLSRRRFLGEYIETRRSNQPCSAPSGAPLRRRGRHGRC